MVFILSVVSLWTVTRPLALEQARWPTQQLAGCPSTCLPKQLFPDLQLLGLPELELRTSPVCVWGGIKETVTYQ